MSSNNPGSTAAPGDNKSPSTSYSMPSSGVGTSSAAPPAIFPPAGAMLSTSPAKGATAATKKKETTAKAPKKPKKATPATGIVPSAGGLPGATQPKPKASKKPATAGDGKSTGAGAAAGTKRKKPSSSGTKAIPPGGSGLVGSPMPYGVTATGGLMNPGLGSNTAAVNMMNDIAMEKARNAANEITRQRTEFESKKSDPFWYSTQEGILTTPVEDSSDVHPSMSYCPLGDQEQVKIVEAALRYNGLSKHDVSPQAYMMLLEQARRYTIELVDGALNFCNNHSTAEDNTEDEFGIEDSIGCITKEDLMLAVELCEDDYYYGRNPSSSGTISISNQLPKLNLVAQQINRIPLPPIPAHCYSGIVLPLDNDVFNATTTNDTTVETIPSPLGQQPSRSQLLTARTYDIISAAHVAQRMIMPYPNPPSTSSVQPPTQQQGNSSGTASRRNSMSSVVSTGSRSNNKKDKAAPGYGANRGRQIPIKLKVKENAGAVEEK